MTDTIAFETPENIQLAYRSAGLGTRFVAWFVDRLILTLILIVVILGVLIGGAASDSVLRNLIAPIADSAEQLESEKSQQYIILYLAGLAVMVLGLSNFIYFGLCELLWRGQTPGKRMSNIRVVKLDGFSLDALSILLRNVFRVLDHLPPLWLVPLLSARHQRFGDLVAGTIVVHEDIQSLGGIRQQLTERRSSELQFRIPAAALAGLKSEDFRAAETLLERWHQLSESRAEQLRAQISSALAVKLRMQLPAEREQLRFIEDVLAAEFQRQHRSLG